MRASSERMGQAGRDNVTLYAPTCLLCFENGVEPGPGASRIPFLTEATD